MSKLIVMTPEELTELVKEGAKSALKSVLEEREDKVKIYTINEVAKMLAKAHQTVKKMVNEGKLKTTPDGRITQLELNRYLGL
jgi:hypothetical protein